MLSSMSYGLRFRIHHFRKKTDCLSWEARLRHELGIWEMSISIDPQMAQTTTPRSLGWELQTRHTLALFHRLPSNLDRYLTPA